MTALERQMAADAVALSREHAGRADAAEACLEALKGAVSKLADDWEQEFARLEPSGADAVSNAGPGSYLVSGRLGALEDCAEALREAITSALTGTPQLSEDENHD